MNAPSERRRSVSVRLLGGITIAALIVIFIAVNRDETRVSFIFFTATVSLWLALTLAAVAGFAAGWLTGRKRRQ